MKPFLGKKELRAYLKDFWSLDVSNTQIEKFINAYQPGGYPNKNEKLIAITQSLPEFYDHIISSTHIPLRKDNA